MKKCETKTDTAVERQLAFRLELMGTAEFGEKVNSDYVAYLHLIIQNSYSFDQKLEPGSGLVSKWNFVKSLHRSAYFYLKGHKEMFEKRKFENDKAFSGVTNIGSGTKLFKTPQKLRKVGDSDKTWRLNSVDEAQKSFFDDLNKVHVKKKPLEPFVEEKVAFEFKKEFLSESDIPYQKAVEVGMKEIQQEYEVGAKENQEVPQYEVKAVDDNKVTLIDKLDSELKVLVNRKKEWEKAILDLANTRNPEETERERTLLRKGAGFEKDLTLADLRGFFLREDKQSLLKGNPYLKNPQFRKEICQHLKIEGDSETAVVDLLMQMMAEHLELMVYQAHVVEAQDLVKGMSDKDPDSIRKVGEILSYERPYDPRYYPECLVFEALSGMRLRKAQAEVLHRFLKTDSNGNYQDLVEQLGMGEGKNDIIASIVLAKAARKGRLALFIVRSAQFNDIVGALSLTQKEYFNQEVIGLDYSADDLYKMEALDELIKKLKGAIDYGEASIVQPQLIQFAWAILKKLATEAALDPKLAAVHRDKIDRLKQIILILLGQTDVLIDEGDSNLSNLFEVNIPGGLFEKLPVSHIAFVLEFFLKLVSDTLKVKTKDGSEISLRQFIGLEKNRQTLLTGDDIKGQVGEVIVRSLAKHYKALQLGLKSDEMQEAFCRYVCDKMDGNLQLYLDDPDEAQRLFGGEPTDLQKIKDLAFLRWRKGLKSSVQLEDKEAYELTGLCRGLFKMVKETFLRQGGRNYGESDREGEVGKIIPFSFGLPTTNEFGEPLEALLVALQHALQFAISEERIQQVGKKIFKIASEEAQRLGRQFDETDEAMYFKSCTGIALSEIDDPKKLAEAVAFVKKDPLRILSIAGDEAVDMIEYYPKCFTANGLSLVELLATARIFSGTTWNTLTLSERFLKLVEQFVQRVGTEGRILDKVLQRAKNNEFATHEVEDLSIEGILGKVFSNHPHKERVLTINDGGGLCKDIPLDQVPIRIWKFFYPEKGPSPVDKPPKRIFSYRQPPEGGNLVPVILQQNEKKELEYIWLKGTKKEHFEEKGFKLNKQGKLEDTFFFLPEAACIGSNVPFPEDIISLDTVSETMLRRIVFQMILRKRQFMTTSRQECIIPAYIRKKIDKGGSSQLHDFFCTTVINQAIQLSKELHKSSLLKIDLIFEMQTMMATLFNPDIGTTEALKQVKPFTEFLENKRGYNPGDDYGSLERDVKLVDALKQYAKAKQEAFTKACGSKHKDLPKQTQSQTDKLLGNLSEQAPTTVKSTFSDRIGSQVQVLREAKSEIKNETKNEVRVDQTIQYELDSYMHLDPGKAKRETDWDGDSVERFIKGIVKNGKPPKPEKDGFWKDQVTALGFAVVSLYEMFNVKLYQSRTEYRKIFGPNEYASENYIYTCETQLPFLHRAQKPADQILVVRGPEGFVFVYLSKEETKKFKEELTKNNPYENRVWLIQPDGTLIYGKVDLPTDYPAVRRALVHANVLRGNTLYLETHPRATREWLEESPELQAMKVRFLGLTVAKTADKRKLAVYCGSKIFFPGQPPLRSLRRKMADKPSLTIKEISTLKDPDMIKTLEEDEVNKLSKENINKTKEGQVKWIDDPTLIQALDEGHTTALKDWQVYMIQEKQVPWIGEDKDKIQALRKELIPHLSDPQLPKLSDEQVAQVDDIPTLLRLSKTQQGRLTPDQGKKVMTALKMVLKQPEVKTQIETTVPVVNEVEKLKELIKEVKRPETLLEMAKDEKNPGSEMSVSLIMKLPESKESIADIPMKYLNITEIGLKYGKYLAPERYKELTNYDVIKALGWNKRP